VGWGGVGGVLSDECGQGGEAEIMPNMGRLVGIKSDYLRRDHGIGCGSWAAGPTTPHPVPAEAFAMTWILYVRCFSLSACLPMACNSGDTEQRQIAANWSGGAGGSEVPAKRAHPRTPGHADHIAPKVHSCEQSENNRAYCGSSHTGHPRAKRPR